MAILLLIYTPRVILLMFITLRNGGKKDSHELNLLKILAYLRRYQMMDLVSLLVITMILLNMLGG